MNEELTLAIEIIRQHPLDQQWFISVKLSPCEIPDRDIGAGETLQDFHYFELYTDWDGGIQRILKVIQPIPVEVQNLIHALQPNDEGVRSRAAEALGQIGEPAKDAVPALIEALDDENQVRSNATKALGWIGEPAVPALIQALGDENHYVRDNAADALGRIGTPEALKAIEAYTTSG